MLGMYGNPVLHGLARITDPAASHRSRPRESTELHVLLYPQPHMHVYLLMMKVNFIIIEEPIRGTDGLPNSTPQLLHASTAQKHL